jgi:hypothetical protein
MKKIISLLLIFCGAFGLSAKKSPNVLYIISDDQAWTDYGFMGHPQIKTPRLDKLAKESVLFERGYVPTALCRPSLVTLINGQYTHKHGVTGNDPSPKTIPPRTVKTTTKREHNLSPIWIVLKPYPTYLLKRATSATKVENGGKEILSMADSPME